MVSTWVELANMALTKLGEARISSLTESSEAAVLCNQFYGKARDAILEVYDWSCASERQQLAEVAGDTLSQYEYRYQLPTDPKCLVPRQLLDCSETDKWYASDQPYEIHGEYLYTDLDDAGLRYTARLTSPVRLSSWLAETIATKLAIDIGYKLKTDFGKTALYQEFMVVISRAYDEDSHSLPMEEASESWVERD